MTTSGSAPVRNEPRASMSDMPPTLIRCFARPRASARCDPRPCQGPAGAGRGSQRADARGRAKHLIRVGGMSDMDALGSFLTGALPLVVIVAIVAYSIRILREYERAVVFLLGR